MNIYSIPGSQVIYSRIINFSYHGQHENAKKHLIMGKVYTVEKTEVASSHTNVYLREFPGIPFPSSCFENI